LPSLSKDRNTNDDDDDYDFDKESRHHAKERKYTKPPAQENDKGSVNIDDDIIKIKRNLEQRKHRSKEKRLETDKEKDKGGEREKDPIREKEKDPTREKEREKERTKEKEKYKEYKEYERPQVDKSEKENMDRPKRYEGKELAPYKIHDLNKDVEKTTVTHQKCLRSQIKWKDRAISNQGYKRGGEESKS